MEIVQAINTGNQLLTAAGMSVSGLVNDFATTRELVYRGFMVGGFVVQQRRGISLFLSMIIEAISRLINICGECESAMNAAMLDLIKDIKTGFGRTLDGPRGRNPFGQGQTGQLPRQKGEARMGWESERQQQLAPVAIPVNDCFGSRPWLR